MTRPTRTALALALLCAAPPAVAEMDLHGTLFRTVDGDGNGRATQPEINMFREQLFAAMDVDRSGDVDRAEFTAVDFGESYVAAMNGREGEVHDVLMLFFEQGDADGNGALTMDEHRRAFFMDWRMADGNGDLTLSEAEFTTMLPIIEALREVLDRPAQ